MEKKRIVTLKTRDYTEHIEHDGCSGGNGKPPANPPAKHPAASSTSFASKTKPAR